MELGSKIRKIREFENLTRAEFSEIAEISPRTLESWETLKRKMSAPDLQKITQNPSFQKYTLWLLNDTIAPESGQVSPEVEQVRGLRA
tara:strand:- start:1244 stop:1507 length:264 start_codon:yes stop_codon:yes gene_type:complete